MKKSKVNPLIKVAVVAALVIIVFVLVRLIMIGGVIAFMAFDSHNAKVEISEDISKYRKHIGKKADKKYQNKWDMDESIFPERITEEMSVKDYKMVYYNPWDAQYLCYLVVDYEQDIICGGDAYLREVERLEAYPNRIYLGYFGVTGFDATKDNPYRKMMLNEGGLN